MAAGQTVRQSGKRGKTEARKKKYDQKAKRLPNTAADALLFTKKTELLFFLKYGRNHG